MSGGFFQDCHQMEHCEGSADLLPPCPGMLALFFGCSPREWYAYSIILGHTERIGRDNGTLGANKRKKENYWDDRVYPSSFAFAKAASASEILSSD